MRGWGWKGNRDTGDLGEELRAVALKSEPRWSALCCGPKKPIGGMTWVPFFLSYWNSATSRGWGVFFGGGLERRIKGAGGHLGVQSQLLECLPAAQSLSCWVSPRLGDKAAPPRGFRVWDWGLVVLRIKGIWTSSFDNPATEVRLEAWTNRSVAWEIGLYHHHQNCEKKDRKLCCATFLINNLVLYNGSQF